MEVLRALAAWPVAGVIRDSAIAYPLVSAAHILGFALLVGAIATLDLRLLGAFRAAPIGALAPPLEKLGAAGLVLAAATGFLLFATRPVAYAENAAFLLKLGMAGIGLLNALALRANRHWRAALAGRGAPHPSVRLAAALSLLVWTGVVVAGRWVGFLQ